MIQTLEKNVERNPSRLGPPSWSRVVDCFTGPGWRTADLATVPGSGTDASLDALVVPCCDEAPVDRLVGAVGLLKPLGRVIAMGERCEAVLRDARLSLSIMSRISLGCGRRIVVAERAGDAGREPRRQGAQAGAYKMSRYRAYHQMQAAIAWLLDAVPREVIEIGDSNGVIRGMLGAGPFKYFRAAYPPHDLQTLHLIPDQSCDVFICDNTLEHVTDPIAAMHHMARVLRPGGWLILFAPFIAMCQDDDRCRWSVRALSEHLSPWFDRGALGGWGNVEAACWYMRANKWLRVLGIDGASLVCRDSRKDDAATVHVPDVSDRLHPIHVWAVAQRANGEPPPTPDAALGAYAGLNPAVKDACERISHDAPPGRVAVWPGDDGASQDCLAGLGRESVGVHESALLATAALNRGFASIDADAPSRCFERHSVAGLLVLSAAAEVPVNVQRMPREGAPVLRVTA